MKEIRIGFIGTGVIAHQHVAQYKKIPGVTLVAACDILADKLQNFCDKYAIEHRYTNLFEMLQRDDLDAIDVCVHNNLHTPISVAVMRAGKHCYCEKPMSGSYVDAVTMQTVAKETGKKLHIQIASLYTPETHAAKKLIDDGVLGKIYHSRSYGYRRRGRPFVDGYAEKEFNSKYFAAGGALYDMGVYHISQILYLLGNPTVERISGSVYQEIPMDEKRRAESGFDVEELGVGFVKLKDGLTLDILEAWAIHAGEFAPSIIAGSQGGLSIHAFGATSDALQFFNEVSGYPMSAKVDLFTEQFRTRQLNPSLTAYDESQAHWVAALREECPLLPTAEIGLNTMLISEGIFMSSMSGREVTATEVKEQSKSQAIRVQEVPEGVLKYEF